MEEIINFKSITEYNNFNNNETLHPLVSVVDLSKADPRKLSKLRYEFYTVFFKEIKCGDLRYGLKNYDYEEGTLIFFGARSGHRGEWYRILPATGNSFGISSRIVVWHFSGKGD